MSPINTDPGKAGPGKNAFKGVVNDWESKDDLQGYMGVTDGPDSGGAVRKALADDLLEARGGSKGQGEFKPRGVVESPQDFGPDQGK